MPDLKKCLASATMALALAGGAMAADAFPTAPVKVIVPYGAGGTGDVVARIVGEKAGAELGQAVVIDNRSGGNGIIGAQAAAKSKADGYTLMLMATGHVILPSLQQVPYDWTRDFAPVFGITTTPLVFAVRSKSDIRTVADLVATAKATPSGLNYASGGAGSVSHLASARLVRELKINGTHVPFRGFGPAVQALLGDQVHFICATVADVVELTKSGDFRLLGVTAEKRHPLLPDVPTMQEQGFSDFHAASWNAYLAPAGTPPQAIDRLNAALAKATADAGVQERLGKLGVSVMAKNRGELETFLKDEAARWRKVIQDNAIKVEN
ncbi:tripartite tricarboxylate transporter substrate binding protein [Variovorax guangxiensis]|uniref:Bug family tripartite tricarboxylate transporter substrate binding protein n=1 Tax=Variovorax guangxiensis TaxID=1775474 RepID=UPI002859CB68|nr:tripartite tricarboxylate transporter substrate binding protein [Variovorax guangxiensis]MDR6854902.1 tripartite-type tricarboxylate transporter receptor subunit TctC [Variovorax guangxiensis]